MNQSDKKFILDFMKAIIEKTNRALATNYAIQQILIEKNIVTKDEMINIVKEAEKLPERKIGIETLNEMLNG